MREVLHRVLYPNAHNNGIKKKVFVLQAPPAHVRVYPKALPAQSVELSAGLALALSGQLKEW